MTILSKQEVIAKIISGEVVSISYFINHTNYTDDEDVMLAAVRQYGFALQFASERLKDNETFISEAIKNDPSAYKYASPRLRLNKNFALTVITKDGRLLRDLNEFNDDFDVVAIAVSQDGTAIRYASSRLRNDRDIMLKAVSQNGYSLKYAVDIFKKDIDVVLLAIFRNPNSLMHACAEFKTHPVLKWYSQHTLVSMEHIKFIFNIYEQFKEDMTNPDPAISCLLNDPDDLFLLAQYVAQKHNIVLKPDEDLSISFI